MASKHDTQCMPQMHADVLRRCRVQLTNDLDCRHITDQLLQEGIITERVLEDLQDITSRQERTAALLDLLPRRGFTSLLVFIKVLKVDYPHLADLLKKRLAKDSNGQYKYYLGGRDVLPVNFKEDDTGYVATQRVEPDQGERAAGANAEISPTAVVVRSCEGKEIKIPGGIFGNRPPLYPRHRSGSHDSPLSTPERNRGDFHLTGKTCNLVTGEIVFLDLAANTPDPTDIVVTNVYSQRLVVSREYLKLYGDPQGEDWFYPVAISSKQATLILNRINLPGCFLVYKPTSRNPDVAYNLSLSIKSGCVKTHHIYQDTNREFFIGEKKFGTVIELVDYYKSNRGILSRRLRRPPTTLANPDFLLQGFDPGLLLDANDVEIGLGRNTSDVWLGHFGEVVPGRYNGEPVAIKVLREMNKPWAMDDFMEEARLSCLAVHKNILRFIGVTSDFDNPQLLSELVGCGDLRRCLKDGKLINGTKKKHKDLFCQVLSALQYLCEAQYILHRDLAARNCLLGSNMQLKLCDFGMARQVKDDEYVAEIDEKVPVRWSAPEVLQSLRYSTASDIWAAGVVFWEICANGMLPYDGLDNSEVTKKITNQGILLQPQECPDEFYELMQKCWLWKAEERPSAELLLDLTRETAYYQPISTDSTDDITTAL